MGWMEPHAPVGGEPSGCGGEGCPLAFPHAAVAHRALEDAELAQLARQGLYVVAASTVAAPVDPTIPAPADEPAETPTSRRSGKANRDAVRQAIADARAVLRGSEAEQARKAGLPLRTNRAAS